MSRLYIRAIGLVVLCGWVGAAGCAAEAGEGQDLTQYDDEALGSGSGTGSGSGSSSGTGSGSGSNAPPSDGDDDFIGPPAPKVGDACDGGEGMESCICTYQPGLNENSGPNGLFCGCHDCADMGSGSGSGFHSG